MSTQATSPAAGTVMPETTPAPQVPAYADTPDEPTQPPAVEGQPGEPAAESTGTSDEQGKPDKRSASFRIRQLNDRLNAAKAEIARLKQPIRPQNVDELDYDAREKLRVREALRENDLERAGKEAGQLQEEYILERNETIRAEVEKAADRIPGLWDKFTRTDERGQFVVEVTEFGADFIAESDKKIELVSFLADNPKEARRIANLPPWKQGIELARLEGRLAPATARKATTAPNPGTTLKGGTPPQGATLSELAESDNMAAYIAARKEAWKGGK